MTVLRPPMFPVRRTYSDVFLTLHWRKTFGLLFGTVTHSSSTELKSSSAIVTLCVCCDSLESLGIVDKPGIVNIVDTAPLTASELTERNTSGGGGAADINNGE